MGVAGQNKCYISSDKQQMSRDQGTTQDTNTEISLSILPDAAVNQRI